jgi:hypothetical protein
MIVSYAQENWCKQINAMIISVMSVIIKKTVNIGFFGVSTRAKICIISLFRIIEYEKSVVIFFQEFFTKYKTPGDRTHPSVQLSVT